MANSLPKVTIQVLEIPISLVLLDKSCHLLLQIKNESNIGGDFKIAYQGDGMQIKSSDLMNKPVFIPPNSSTTDRVELIPSQTGLISLEARIFFLKEIIKEATRTIEIPSQTGPTEILDDPLLQGALDILGSTPSQPESQTIVEKIKEFIEEEIFSTSIYLNALDKNSSAVLKRFAQKGDSNILTGAGLPLCLCYFYSESQNSKWKLHPALIRNLCFRMKEKFGKVSYYISYPLSKNIQQEIQILQEAIQTFILPYSTSSKSMLLLNLDIIPELEKPSIIIGYEKTGIYETVKNHLTDVFKDTIDIYFDDCIFSGGLLYDYLVNWTGSSQIRVLNIILSNNFITNRELFQNFIKSLVSFTIGGV